MKEDRSYTKEDKTCVHCGGDVLGHLCGYYVNYWCNKCGANNRTRKPLIEPEVKPDTNIEKGLKIKISEILVKHSMPTRQVAINEIVKLLETPTPRVPSIEDWDRKKILDELVDRFQVLMNMYDGTECTGDVADFIQSLLEQESEKQLTVPEKVYIQSRLLYEDSDTYKRVINKLSL